MNVCEKLTIENCQIVEDFEKCSICDKGYYLNSENKCVKNPVAGIKNCLIYTAINFCL